MRHWHTTERNTAGHRQFSDRRRSLNLLGEKTPTSREEKKRIFHVGVSARYLRDCSEWPIRAVRQRFGVCCTTLSLLTSGLSATCQKPLRSRRSFGQANARDRTKSQKIHSRWSWTPDSLLCGLSMFQMSLNIRLSVCLSVSVRLVHDKNIIIGSSSPVRNYAYVQ